jgi:hypothetical protein
VTLLFADVATHTQMGVVFELDYRILNLIEHTL